MFIHQSPPALRHAWQLWCTKRILRTAYNHVPAYRNLLQQAGIHPLDIKKFSDIQRIPIVNKQFFRNHQWEEITHNVLRDFSNSYRMVQTSGSTGEPFSFPQSTNSYIHPGYSPEPLRANPLLYRFLFWKGYKLEDVYLTKRVVGIRIYDRPSVKNYLYIPVQKLHDAKKELTEKIIAFHPDILEGRVSVLIEFAYIIEKQGERMQFPYIITHGEMINNSQREYLEKILGSMPFSRYSLEEIPDVAIDCIIHTGFHIHEESLLLEVLNDVGEPVEPNTPGRIIITSFGNEIMPFIRYDTGDIGMILPGICECGVRARRLRLLSRKQMGHLSVDKRKYHISEFEAFFDRFTESVLQYQIEKTGENEIEIRILPSKNFSESSESEIKFRFHKYFGVEPGIRLVDSIRQDGEEKIKFVIDKTNETLTGIE
jgi:phenylacetate-CoA ligase